MEFCDFVGELAGGQVAQRLSEALGKLVEAVQDTHGKGTIAVTFTIAEEGRQVKVDTKVDVKPPQHPLHGSLFFYVPDRPGEISRDDVRQLKLRSLVGQVVRRAADAPEEVDPETGEVLQ